MITLFYSAFVASGIISILDRFVQLKKISMVLKDLLLYILKSLFSFYFPKFRKKIHKITEIFVMSVLFSKIMHPK